MSHGKRLRERVGAGGILPFIGVYDVFSASLAARRHDALFLSGFGFSASFYGLPDGGFITWSDIIAYVGRTRTVLPGHHLLVDMDDGYGDTQVASHVAALLERAGASGIVMEDQRRPRRCGHLDGKQLLELDEYMAKLEAVLAARRDLFVVARTDAWAREDIFRRVEAMAGARPDALLVDGIGDLDLVRELAAAAAPIPLTFNQIAGGKSPPRTLGELERAGVGLAIYSTPCLFAAQRAMEDALADLFARDGLLPEDDGPRIGVAECNRVLNENLARHLAGGLDTPSTLRAAD